MFNRFGRRQIRNDLNLALSRPRASGETTARPSWECRPTAFATPDMTLREKLLDDSSRRAWNLRDELTAIHTGKRPLVCHAALALRMQ